MYKIYAVRYAHRESASRAANFYGGDPHDAPMPMDYFIWALVGESRAFVVDAGFTPETAARRPGREMICDPAEVLRELGADPATLEDVLLTHLHYDHVGQVGAFPKARFWLQDSEMAFWTGRYANRPAIRHTIEPDDIVGLVRLNFEGRLRFVDRVTTAAPGITLHPVGGHSPGLQVLRVQTEHGAVVLASDASHYYENLETDRPFAVVHSVAGMYETFDHLHELADSPRDIVPGHDPLVLERYPAVSPDLSGVAVEITAGRRED